MRFECERDDIPRKWTEVDIVPGEGDEWLLIKSNGIVDPSKQELVINKPTIESRGTLQQVTEDLEKVRISIEAFGYKRIQLKEDEELPQL
jgi:hypothetical protein